MVEIPKGSRNKYEYDPRLDRIRLDRTLFTATGYPSDYGFVPDTLAEDGDPIDVLIVGPGPVLPGAVVPCRPVGALLMEDEYGRDEKIIAVPVERVRPFDAAVRSQQDLPAAMRDQIVHFFEHYKDLEPGKWVKVERWVGAAEAAELIRQALARAGAKQVG